MILKALYDYYYRCDNLPSKGLEEMEIDFLLVLSSDGQFLRFEDCREDKNNARVYLVKRHIEHSNDVVADYLYGKSAYVLGYSDKSNDKGQIYFDTFKEKIDAIANAFSDNKELSALKAFYKNSRETIIQIVSQDPLWEDIKKNLSKKYSIFSFRIEGDLKILAEKRELLQLDDQNDDHKTENICLVTGKHGPIVETTTATMIPGSQAKAKLVSFQSNSGYDSYGKTKCGNAPISVEAEFAYTTALKSMLQKNSRNKFLLGNRTFVFWASSNNEVSIEAEESLYELLCFSEKNKDDPNANVRKVTKVFESINSGELKTSLNDKFYILGLAPNMGRIAVVFWSEIILKDFAEKILKHFNDMEIIDTRKDKKPYMGIREIISSVTLRGKMSDATPNLPEAIVKSIFQGFPYPASLYSACIRRIRAEQKLTITRAAIIKAYLNRQNNNDKKIETMLDKENCNQGYLCGRLFAVMENLQFAANGQDSIRSSYMNAASTTPSTVFSTILKLSNNHYGKLVKDKKCLANFYDDQKKEIMALIQKFPDTLDLSDQGRFFLGYYHQKNDKDNKKSDE